MGCPVCVLKERNPFISEFIDLALIPFLSKTIDLLRLDRNLQPQVEHNGYQVPGHLSRPESRRGDLWNLESDDDDSPLSAIARSNFARLDDGYNLPPKTNSRSDSGDENHVILEGNAAVCHRHNKGASEVACVGRQLTKSAGKECLVDSLDSVPDATAPGTVPEMSARTQKLSCGNPQDSVKIMQPQQPPVVGTVEDIRVFMKDDEPHRTGLLCRYDDGRLFRVSIRMDRVVESMESDSRMAEHRGRNESGHLPFCLGDRIAFIRYYITANRTAAIATTLHVQELKRLSKPILADAASPPPMLSPPLPTSESSHLPPSSQPQSVTPRLGDTPGGLSPTQPDHSVVREGGTKNKMLDAGSDEAIFGEFDSVKRPALKKRRISDIVDDLDEFLEEDFGSCQESSGNHGSAAGSAVDDKQALIPKIAPAEDEARRKTERASIGIRTTRGLISHLNGLWDQNKADEFREGRRPPDSRNEDLNKGEHNELQRWEVEDTDPQRRHGPDNIKARPKTVAYGCSRHGNAVTGYRCSCCEEFYELAAHEVRLTQKCSRNRFAAVPPPTPKGYWDVGFPPTQKN